MSIHKQSKQFVGKKRTCFTLGNVFCSLFHFAYFNTAYEIKLAKDI